LDTNYYVVEAPARYAKKLAFNTDSNATNINGITRLLVLKNKKYGGQSAVLMQIHGAPGVDISKAHYMDLPANFSGNIFFTSLQGAFINGYVYKGGKIALVSGARSNTKPAGPQILLADGTCEEIDIDWESRWCDAYGNCTEWVYDHTDTYIYCTPGSQGGGSSGGGSVTPPPCVQGSSIETASVNGKLVVRFFDGGDDGSGNNPCEPPPEGFRPLCKGSIILTPSSVNTSEVNMTGVLFGILDEPHFPFYQTQVEVIEFNLYINIPNKITNPDDRSKTIDITEAMQKEFIYQAYHFASEQTNIAHSADFFASGSQPKYSAMFAAFVAYYLNNLALHGMFTGYENNNPGLVPSLGARTSTLINPSKAHGAVYTNGVSGEGC
jgi:hypothetical protein